MNNILGQDLSYLNTEYAREKMIESYRREEKNELEILAEKDKGAGAARPGGVNFDDPEGYGQGKRNFEHGR